MICFPEKIHKGFLKKIYRHYLMNISSASVSVIKTYLFLICNLPWQLSLWDYPPGINESKVYFGFLQFNLHSDIYVAIESNDFGFNTVMCI